MNLLCESNGRPPKVVSSTATIRRAGDQVEGLFGRDVRSFPSIRSRCRRLVLRHGRPRSATTPLRRLMAQGHTSDTAIVQAVRRPLQAPVDLRLGSPEQDAYWTLVAYHNSLRELGRTVTMALDDIQARLASLMAGRPLPRVRRRGADVERSPSTAATAAGTSESPGP